jgi:hypothetical protein
MKRSDPDFADEYDLSRGQRGRHAAAYRKGTNVVLIDPELVPEFPTREAVNDALREIVEQRRRKVAVAK